MNTEDLKTEWESKIGLWNQDVKNVAIASGSIGFIGVGLLASMHYLDFDSKSLDLISQYLGAGGFLTAGITILTASAVTLYKEFKREIDTLLDAEPTIKKKKNSNLKYLIKDTRNGELNFYLMDEYNKDEFIRNLSPADEVSMIEVHKENIYLKKMRNGKYHNSDGPGLLELYNKRTVDKENYLDIVNDLYFIDGKKVKKIQREPYMKEIKTPIGNNL